MGKHRSSLGRRVRRERAGRKQHPKIAVLGSRKAIKALTPSLPRYFFNRIVWFPHRRECVGQGVRTNGLGVLLGDHFGTGRSRDLLGQWHAFEKIIPCDLVEPFAAYGAKPACTKGCSPACLHLTHSKVYCPPYPTRVKGWDGVEKLWQVPLSHVEHASNSLILRSALAIWGLLQDFFNTIMGFGTPQRNPSESCGRKFPRRLFLCDPAQFVRQETHLPGLARFSASRSSSKNTRSLQAVEQ